MYSVAQWFGAYDDHDHKVNAGGARWCRVEFFFLRQTSSDMPKTKKKKVYKKS